MLLEISSSPPLTDQSAKHLSLGNKIVLLKMLIGGVQDERALIILCYESGAGGTPMLQLSPSDETSHILCNSASHKNECRVEKTGGEMV